MRIFLYQLFRNLLACFTGVNLLVHLLAFAVTYFAVVSGFDWWWYTSTRAVPRFVRAPGIGLGLVLPVVLTLVLLVIGAIRKKGRLTLVAGAIGQAAGLGWIISSTYKVFTGRAHPELWTTLEHDISRDFLFGFLRAGIFWGWPSSHTTVAFAMSVTLARLFWERTSLRMSVLLYALYVGLAVSVSIHWFSDFLAGALIGTLVGVVVGRSFSKHELWIPNAAA